MELIEAIIKPFKLDNVQEILMKMGINGATITEVKRHASLKKPAQPSATYWIDFHPMIKLEVVVPAERRADAIEAILHAARTGKLGDGMIYVFPVNQAMRIRTGEQGIDAL